MRAGPVRRSWPELVALRAILLNALFKQANAQTLTEVRHGMNVKRPKSFGISSGCCKVCTTCGKRFQTFRQTEAELMQ